MNFADRATRPIVRAFLACCAVPGFDGLEEVVSDWVFHAGINEVQREHAQECVDQGLNYLASFPTAPDRWQSEQADQIANAALKALNLLSRTFDVQILVP